MIDEVGTPDGVTLDVHHWPVAEPRAVVQIVHGMAEHMGRYDEVAAALNRAGYAVIGHDQRGHGATAGSAAEMGFISESDGWKKYVDDVDLMSRTIAREYPGVPIVLLGHSMGTLVARTAVQELSHYSGLILSGAAADPGALRFAAMGIAEAQLRAKGPRHRSMVLHRLTFGAYNDHIDHPRTAFDWLSRDPDAVDAYVNDPACGWIATTSFYRDLFTGLGRVYDPKRIRRMPRDLPVLFFSGDDDPVGGRHGAGVTAAARKMRKHVERVDVRLYAKGRHESFNEINRDEVIADVIRWCDGIIPGRA